MPHDKNGKPLKKGDIVNLRCRVDEVFDCEEACNVNLTAIDGPEDEYKPSFTANTRSSEKIQDAPAE